MRTTAKSAGVQGGNAINTRQFLQQHGLQTATTYPFTSSAGAVLVACLWLNVEGQLSRCVSLCSLWLTVVTLLCSLSLSVLLYHPLYSVLTGGCVVATAWWLVCSLVALTVLLQAAPCAGTSAPSVDVQVSRN